MRGPFLTSETPTCNRGPGLRRVLLCRSTKHLGGWIDVLDPPKDRRIAKCRARHAAERRSSLDFGGKVGRELHIHLLPTSTAGYSSCECHGSFRLAPMKPVLPGTLRQKPAHHILEHRSQRAIQERRDAFQVRVNLRRATRRYSLQLIQSGLRASNSSTVARARSRLRCSNRHTTAGRRFPVDRLLATVPPPSNGNLRPPLHFFGCRRGTLRHLGCHLGGLKRTRALLRRWLRDFCCGLRLRPRSLPRNSRLRRRSFL
ncbi:Uncharacterised protein [Burkholderia pseudomallei]|nr:Uncharacterised protein [Burkholderia pseudomallei]